MKEDHDAASLAGKPCRHPAAASRSREIPEFTDLVLACRHRLFQTALVGGILSSIVIGIAWTLYEPRYKAESLVRVRAEQDVVFAAQTSRATDSAFFHSQEGLVLSPQVVAAALNHQEVRAFAHLIPDHNQVDWLRQLLRVDMESGSEVMSIAASHGSPHLAQALSKAVTQAYLTEITNRLTRDRENRERELELATRAADKRLDELWAELNRIAHSVGSDSTHSLTIRDELQFQAYRDYARQLQQAQLRGSELQRLLADQELRMDQELSNVDQVAEALLQKHPEVVTARLRVQTVESQIQEMRQIAAGDGSPRLERLFKDRDFHVAELDRIIGRLRPQLREQSREQSRQDQENSLAQLKQQFELNRAEKELLRNRLSDIDIGTSRTEDDSGGVQLDMSRHAVDRQSRLADSLWQSLQEFRIENRSQPRVTLVQLAQLPGQANHSRQLKAVGAAAFFSWTIAMLVVGYFEWRDCRVRYAEDVTLRSAFPVFGSDCLSGGNTFDFRRKNVRGGVQEAAATMMLHDQHGQSIPTLLVSSSVSSEPRHLVSVELAQAFCKCNRRTLIIDCDTGRSCLSRRLGAQRLSGIRQFSPSGTDIRQQIIPTDQHGIDFLPVGQCDDDETWIDPQTFKSVIHSLRRDYQAIVVNGSAVLASAECLLLASQVDVTLLSVFVGTSRWSQLAVSEQSAMQSGISIGGSIIHSGKRSTKLQLMLDRRGEASHFQQHDATETELRNQLDEMENDLRKVRSDSVTSEQSVRPRQESST